MGTGPAKVIAGTTGVISCGLLREAVVLMTVLAGAASP